MKNCAGQTAHWNRHTIKSSMNAIFTNKINYCQLKRAHIFAYFLYFFRIHYIRRWSQFIWKYRIKSILLHLNHLCALPEENALMNNNFFFSFKIRKWICWAIFNRSLIEKPNKIAIKRIYWLNERLFTWKCK